MNNQGNAEDMEMPTPCQRCDDWFDLMDGMPSQKWYPNTTICSSCETLESQFIKAETEKEDATEYLENVEWEYKDAIKRIKKATTAYVDFCKQHNL